MASKTQTEVETKKATALLLQNVERTNTAPLWLQMARYNPPLPNPTCVPHVWRYADIRPNLLQAGELVPEEQAERRVLMFVNPAREAPYTTDTLYTGLQLVMPNETAKAHRHTAFALRFIIEGEGGFTAVHGKRIKMKRGDVILTPSWNWHDHGKDGSGPMIWLDGLDLPNFTYFPVHFVEHFASPRYPATDVDASTSPLVFPWAKMQAALDKEPEDSVTLLYLHGDGREVSKTIGASATRITEGKSTKKVQETASSVYHVVQGSGQSVINGETYSWQQGDTFCIPSWHAYQHFAGAGPGPTYLYRFDDKPMLRSLGFYRTSDMDTDTLVSE
ncbi:hypothetical protein JX265_005749 [Neoarthrinium moseri]|uniref:Cupin type-2 domain-containing protein n=1 Tax=Neoarthrinium moseri TaxID=1658444 RepID=A0A9P9WNM8_9PEZI|nr:uncharacterized protein JN550_012278 [Neoarthrinium moseri]KAI1839905.1 hypothetical protein JX266_013886 [Neoarthrinium moseri]KAI1858920.1 hypothetical protein JN550_012278 [Neoarthrinium moseri]KAI1871763.1 hypothetical protein JX265_005749 [Neoarthrinium moseri]